MHRFREKNLRTFESLGWSEDACLLRIYNTNLSPVSRKKIGGG